LGAAGLGGGGTAAGTGVGALARRRPGGGGVDRGGRRALPRRAGVVEQLLALDAGGVGPGTLVAVGTGAIGTFGEHGGVEVLDELVEQLGADVGHDTTAELGDLAGDLQVGDDRDLGALAGGDERGGDDG